MKTDHPSVPVTDLNPSPVTNASWDSRSTAISQETKRTKVRGGGFAFLLASFLGSCVTTQLGAQVIVVPNALATNDGNGFGTSPTGGPTSVRAMRIFDASQFAALSGPSLLTQFAWRPDRILGQSGPRSVNLRIYASTTTRSVAGLSMTFADNLGADNTLVFNGTLNWTTGNLPGPGNTRQFDVVFPCTTPFLYDPAAGNLLLDTQLSANGQSITLDTVVGNPTGREIVNSTSSTAVTAAFVAPAVQVTQFTFEPPPSVPPTFSDGNWSSMGGIPGADRSVFAVVVDGSGNLYIGGSFSLAGEVVANSVAKWDGSSWTALASGLNGPVRALAVSGSDLYAGGYFTTAGGLAATNIAKWNGSSWSALGSGMNGGVFALAVSGSTLYAGGSYTTAGGSAATNIAKWDGSSWTALGSGVGGGNFGELSPGVSALAVSGNNVYAGGLFRTAGGNAAGSFAKWDGSSWTALGSGIGGEFSEMYAVSALAVSDGDLYAAGLFTTAGGHATNIVSKWDGRAWSALGSGWSRGGDFAHYTGVSALAVSGGDLYAAGLFTMAGGSAATNIAKWDGGTWSGLGSGLSGGGAHPSVSALAVAGSDLYAGGEFLTAGGSAATHIAKWEGGIWSGLGSGIVHVDNIDESHVSALALSGDNIYAAGYFATGGGQAAKRVVAKWDGRTWSVLGSGMDGVRPHFVYALAVSGRDLYAGIYSATADGQATTSVAKWDGRAWLALGAGMEGVVGALVASGNDLYAAADSRVAQWNGSRWSWLGSGFAGVQDLRVSALAILGSDLYAAGRFTTAGGGPARGIAKWDGSSWTALGLGLNGYVFALAVSGDHLYAGGQFTTAGGDAARNIAKWDGTRWTALGLGLNGNVSALAVSGSDLYAAGWFTTAGGSAANHIAKWDGTRWTALGSGINENGGVLALAASGSDLYVGGWFTMVGGKVSANVARAYLRSLPTLSVFHAGENVTVSWPAVDTAGFTLEQAGPLAASGGWITNPATVTDDGANKSVTLPATNSPHFFRLRRP
ncbi:MAG: hypothetical protein AB9869_01045 [Verrucomicrobiia bacterium]